MAVFFMGEDDPLMARMYERAFRLSGHTLTIASDGEAALTVLPAMKEKPVAIILDVMMPKKSGFDVLTTLKADPAYKDIPMVMLTNLSGKEDAEKALSLGAVAYLV